MLASHYADLLLMHVCCVTLSGGLFLLRGLLRIQGSASANAGALRVASVAIDTALLIAAVLLTMILHQYPFVDRWLTVKILLLVVYMGLGSVALKRARTRAGRTGALVASLAIFAFMIGVALAHRAAGWLSLIG